MTSRESEYLDLLYRQIIRFQIHWSIHCASISQCKRDTVEFLHPQCVPNDAIVDPADRSPSDMNDEPPASASSSRAARTYDNHAEEDVPPTTAQLAERRKHNREQFNRKRGQFLDDLIYNLDVLIYAELSVIYYLDNSFFRLFIRLLLQFVLLTPKPAHLPVPGIEQQPVVTALLSINAICVFLHLWLRAPSAGEPTRGYLHGGLAIDLIGQLGPSSKALMVGLDVLVAGLQMGMLSVVVTRGRLNNQGMSGTAVATAAAAPAQSAASQDVDSEERGVRRSAELEQQGDIEMQSLNPSSGQADRALDDPPDAAEDEEDSPSSDRDRLLAASTAPRSDVHIFDAFHSGQIVLGDFNVLRSAREQMAAYQKATPESRSERRAMYQTQFAERVRFIRRRLGAA